VLLHIGCGKGRPDLKISEQNKIKMIGIDIITEAIHKANLLKENFDLSYTPKFEVGGFCSIPMLNNSIDAVISIDAFWMAKNKADALKGNKKSCEERCAIQFYNLGKRFSRPVISDDCTWISSDFKSGN
jgi:ubiquinone/menaquinone biosynthesis C-methylase UbiE